MNSGMVMNPASENVELNWPVSGFRDDHKQQKPSGVISAMAGKSSIKSSMIFPTNETSIRFVVVYFRSPAMFGYGIH